MAQGYTQHTCMHTDAVDNNLHGLENTQAAGGRVLSVFVLLLIRIKVNKKNTLSKITHCWLSIVLYTKLLCVSNAYSCLCLSTSPHKDAAILLKLT